MSVSTCPHLMVGWHGVLSLGCCTASVSLGNSGWALSAPGLHCSRSQPLPAPCVPSVLEHSGFHPVHPANSSSLWQAHFLRWILMYWKVGSDRFRWVTGLGFVEQSGLHPLQWCHHYRGSPGVRILAEHPSCFHIRFIVTLAGRWRSQFREDDIGAEGELWGGSASVSSHCGSRGLCHGRGEKSCRGAWWDTTACAHDEQGPVRREIVMIRPSPEMP